MLEGTLAQALESPGDAPFVQVCIMSQLTSLKLVSLSNMCACMVICILCAPTNLVHMHGYLYTLCTHQPCTQPRIGARRVVVLSGMYPEEVGIMLEAYAQSGMMQYPHTNHTCTLTHVFSHTCIFTHMYFHTHVLSHTNHTCIVTHNYRVASDGMGNCSAQQPAADTGGPAGGSM